ncbi:MAG: two-component regulator propeller domain-containing protein [Cytophagaceae bacterium]
MIVRITAIILSCILSFYSFGQKPNLVFHHLSVHDGLSENTIRGILQDKKGFMWFATEDGLNRYDGYNFYIYKKNSNDKFSLSSSNIKGIFLDSKNYFWVLTNNGLNIYDPVHDMFYNYRNNRYPVLKFVPGNMEYIVEDSFGDIWVVAGEEGMYKISSLSEKPDHYEYQVEESTRFISLQQESDTSMWIGTMDGLFRFNTLTKEFTDLRQKYGRGYEVRTMYRDVLGNLWMCTTNGLKIIFKSGEMKEYLHNPTNPYSINGNNIMNVVQYKDGNYLVAIDGAALDYFDISTDKFYHYKDELSSNNVTYLYKDPQGDLWAGTFLNGISFSNSSTNLFVHIKNNPYAANSIKKGIVTRFLKDRNGNLWIATDGGGLYRKKKDVDEYKYFALENSGLSSNSIVSLMEDETGFLWLTTYGGGLCKFDPVKEKFKVFRFNSKDPSSLGSDKIKDVIFYQNRIWITGYGTGIHVMDPVTEKFTQYRFNKNDKTSIRTDFVQSFLIDKENNLWVSSLRGLSRFDTTTDAFVNYTFENREDESADINFIVDLIEDSKGNIWLASSGSGLLSFNKNDGSYKVFTKDQGLSDNSLKSLIEDNDGYIWLSSNNGITRFNPATLTGKSYTIKEGAPACSFYFNARYKDEDGRIYFGANNGYVIIDPRSTGVNRRIPPIVVTGFKIFNQEITNRMDNSPLSFHISRTREINLGHAQNSFTFEFVSLNYNNSRNNKYSYILEGFDDDWISGDQRFATYTNINPGTYVFKVKGSNNDNVWNEEGVSITIHIAAPYWETSWFRGIVAIVILALLYLVYLWGTRAIKKRNVQLEEIVKQRTLELRQSNEQLETFVYKASHDIKGPLKSIIGLTTIGKKDVKEELAHTYFDHILKSTRKLDNLLRDLLEITKVKQAKISPEKINFREIINDVLASFENFPGYENFKIVVAIKEGKPFYSDKNLVYSIIQNLIENPLKYADTSKQEKRLDISIITSEKGADMIFRDNGIGIAKEYQDKIFDMFFKVDETSNGTGLGLYIVKTTVQKLNGYIEVESETGKGTTFHVKL